MFDRRSWLRTMGFAAAAGSLLTTPLRLFAAGREGFEATSIDAALKAVLVDGAAQESDQIKFKIPDIAENGAVVPVTVSTDIANVQAISIVVENNPNPLTSRIEISADAFADVSMRVKMGQSSVVRVYVHTADKVYTTSKEVKVTIGGCGG